MLLVLNFQTTKILRKENSFGFPCIVQVATSFQNSIL